MSRQSPPIIVIHRPSTPEGKISLAQQVGIAHAEQVRRHVQGLKIPSDTKMRLVDAVLANER